MAHHNTIPNSAICILLHTPTHGNTPTIATVSPLPLTTPCYGSWWYWQHDGTLQQAMRINMHPTTAQHTNMLPVYLFNESLFWSNNIFLNDLCHYMVFFISEFLGSIYTFITHGLAQASNIHMPSQHMVRLPQVLLFQSCTNTMYINHSYTRNLFFSKHGIEYYHKIQN